jgi:hypothetical protein
MFLLGGALSTGLWYRLVTDGRWRYVVAYVAVAVLTLHAHYLVVLTLAAHALWWIIVAWIHPAGRRNHRSEILRIQWLNPVSESEETFA